MRSGFRVFGQGLHGATRPPGLRGESAGTVGPVGSYYVLTIQRVARRGITKKVVRITFATRATIRVLI